MSRNLLGRLLVTSAALALAACVDGEGTNFAPPAARTPAPTPSPPPPPPPAQIFSGITTDTNFAALGLEVPALVPAGSVSASSLVRDGFSVKFDAASKTYVIGLPFQTAQTSGPFVSQSSDPKFFYGVIQGTSYSNVAVFRPSASNPAFQLAYTSFGMADGYYVSPVSFFAFGSATPASGIPPTGSATYDAYVAGVTMDAGGSGFPSRLIGGSATLQFDFSTGTLAGHFDPILTVSGLATNLGSYGFVNPVFGAGKTNFSGQLSISGTSALGAFDGQFTGPAAQELMARWNAPYLIPGTQQWSQMFGVWVGKKH